jgi:hypothetical protein
MAFFTMLIVGLILSAASLALSEILKPKPNLENARPAGLGDFRFPTAVEGRPVPIIWGTVKLAGPNVVWYGDLKQYPIREKVKTGLFSSKRITVGYHYYVGIQFALCRGEIDEFTKIYVGDKPHAITSDRQYIYNPTWFGDNGGMVGWLQFYPGTETQTVDTYLTGKQSPLPAYRGTSYAVWEGGWIGDSPNIQAWSFELGRFPKISGSAYKVNGDKDANPACVLYEILTDDDWGFGFSAADLDVTSFTAAASTLVTEGNGFSFILDGTREATDLMEEVQRQIDGVVYLDQTTGKFTLKLARDDYDIDLVPEVDSTNQIEVREFSHGTWEETTNQVRVGFVDRARNYFETFAMATDLANQRIQGGQLVSVQQQYPGVKDKTLAASIAARELRALSVPLAKAEVVTDRSMWQLKPGDVVAWTDENLGIDKVAMRVNRVNFGELTSGRIIVSLTQDIFEYTSPFDGEPPDPEWEPPEEDVSAIPDTESKVFEAPYALIRRDEAYPDVLDRIWAGGRHQGTGEYYIKIYQRNAPGVPSGSYVNSGEVYGFLLIGELRTALDGSGTQTTIEVDPSPDAIEDLEDAFSTNVSDGDLGQYLVNLIMIGDEFFLVKDVTNQTTYLDFDDAYRAVLDTVPEAHSAGADVWLLFVAGGLTDDTIPQTNNVDVQLRSVNRTDEVTEAEADTIQITMANRARRPYPPAHMGLNGAPWDDDVDVDDPWGSGIDNVGIVLTIRRRDYRNLDEVESLGADAASFVADFLSATNHENQATLTDDPDGTPTLIETKTWSTTNAWGFSRTKILRVLNGVLPTRMRMEVEARHDYAEVSYEARDVLTWDFDVSFSDLVDDFNLGVLAYNVTSNSWTAPVAGTYNVTLGVALSGNVEYRLNGGMWTVAVTAGNTVGALTGVAVNDTIEIRHLDNSGSGTTETMCLVNAPTVTTDAYAVLVI